jgi:hypothetical protein
VVPGLFWLIADSKQAGSIATQFFYAQTFFGVLFGLIYWVLRRRVLDALSKRCLLAAVAAPLLFFVVLTPWMNAARAAADMVRFGQLHGAASGLFLIACVAVGTLVWRLPANSTRPAA